MTDERIRGASTGMVTGTSRSSRCKRTSSSQVTRTTTFRRARRSVARAAVRTVGGFGVDGGRSCPTWAAARRSPWPGTETPSTASTRQARCRWRSPRLPACVSTRPSCTGGPAATLDPRSAEVLIEQFTGGMGFLLGFSGKADELPEPARVQIPRAGVTVAIERQVSLSTSTSEWTATFTGEA